MRTWIAELIAVSTVICLTTYLFSNNDWANWLATIAVLLTFQHIQVSDRLHEKQKIITDAPKGFIVHCAWKLNILLALKEVVWVIVFLMLHTYAAIVGAVLFMLYPLWRKFWRKIHPQSNQ